MATKIGGLLLATLSIAIGALALFGVDSISRWWLAVLVPLVGAGIVLWMKPDAPKRPSAFVSGDAHGSKFSDIDSNADVIVGGSAQKATFKRIRQRRR